MNTKIKLIQFLKFEIICRVMFYFIQKSQFYMKKP